MDLDLVGEKVMASRVSAVASTVYIVDDDISVREALEALIREAGWQPLVCASAREFLMQAPAIGPTCLILDVSLPDLSGLELQQRIAEKRSEMPIVFITGHGDIPTSVRAMKAGAIEFLTKPFCDEVMLEAVRSALVRSVDALAATAESQSLRDRYEHLSGREREVMALVVSGLMNKQVAGELGISEITVKAHRGRVMRKMNARSFADLVNIAGKLRIPH